MTNGDRGKYSGMAITVEFFGIPRERAGVSQATVEAGSFDQILSELAGRFPGFCRDCLELTGDRWQLRSLYLASIGGDRFVDDPEIELRAGDSLLILSADAGG